jgi:serpin B
MKNYLFFCICIVSAVCFGAWGCGSDAADTTEEDAKEETKKEADGDGSSTTDGEIVMRETLASLPKNTAFAFNLLRSVSKDEAGDGNIFISPLSANIALSMLANGAAGQTRQNMLEALGYGDLSTEAVNAYLRDLAVFRPEHADVTVEQGNSVWAGQALPLLPSFTETLQSFYGADIENGDFTTEMINRWCEAKTHGRIPQLLDEAADDFYLINTLYFKAKWSSPFNPDYTKEESFTNGAGVVRPAPAMNQALVAFAFRGESFDLLELDYAGNAYSMVVLLPKEGASVSAILGGLDPEAWRQALSGMCLHEVSLKLPSFKVDYAKTLNEVLKAVGLQSVFDASADFSSISPSFDMGVSRIVQKSFAQVNEEGTEAAAATYVAMFGSGGATYPQMEFHVNRPFLFLIHEKSTGVILFAGEIRSLS